jgi:2-polyprenyl-6-methoxyphenol hydroxylase-like FAD-dependent oxidoreductase
MSLPPPALGRRAVVLGASMAGLLAARVLAERFAEVLLLERDVLDADAKPRKGTPHAVHPHGLLARGREVMEELFPGFTQALVDQGALLGDLQQQVAFDVGRRRLAEGRAGHPGLAVSRLAIEAELRRRVRALPNVHVIDGVDVLSPMFDVSSGRVTGARCAARDGARRERMLQADLVVDCTGRASRMPQWLTDWGYPRPAEERVEVGICYTSAYFRRTGSLAFGAGMDKAAVIVGVNNEQPRPGVLIAQEPLADGVPRWVVGVGGYVADHAMPTLEGLRAHARTMGSPEILRLVQEGEAIGDVMRYHYPSSVRRRYEELARFPAGLLVMGDALTSFNPIYGQGMTVAAVEALALRDALDRGDDGRLDAVPGGLARRFFRAAARVIDVPWQLAVGGDLAIDAVIGPRPLPVRLVNAYIARLLRVAVHDPEASLAFLKVVNLLERPESLFAPRLVWRVLRGPRAARPVAQPAVASGAG